MRRPGLGRGRWLWALAAVLWAGALVHDRLEAWIAATELPPLEVAFSPEVRDREGRLLRAFTVADGRWRLAVRLEDVDPRYVELLLAYEDRRFRRHGGVDPRAVIRAGWQAVRHGRVVSGASTLTMQVARLLENGPTGSWRGKLRQIRVALALERRLTKDEILTLYLNRAPFGGNVEGIRAATLTWFGKEPRRLSLAEAALMIALPQAPERRRPDRHHAAARTARAGVLGRLVAAGAIAPAEAEAALGAPLPGARRPLPLLAPHLAERLRRARPGTPVLHTTLDAGLQRRLETLAARLAREAGAQLSVAILVADHRTGAILAEVGAAIYGDAARGGYLDMTRALRSPGSTLKPLVYGLAFDQGLAHPETLIDDRPTAFGEYAPRNFDGVFHGTLTVREALVLSLNLPAVLLAEALGPARLMAHLRRAGLRPVVPGGRPGLALALGGVGLSLRDLVALYAGLAQLGRAVELSELPSRGGPGERRFLSVRAAGQVGWILSGLPAPPGAARRELAYKTGTSYGRRDAWAIGFDGAHVAGVWVGRPDGTAVPGALGAGLAAPALFEVFSRLGPRPVPLPAQTRAAGAQDGAGPPAALRRFRPAGAFPAPRPDAPRLAFPPEGAELVGTDGRLVVKVARGRPPFTWLANGRPVLARSRVREAVIELPEPGFVILSVIDAAGRADRVRIRVQ